MTDYHIITPEEAELVMQVIDGQLFIVPPVTLVAAPHFGPPAEARAEPHLGPPAPMANQTAAAPAQPAPDK